MESLHLVVSAGDGLPSGSWFVCDISVYLPTFSLTSVVASIDG